MVNINIMYLCLFPEMIGGDVVKNYNKLLYSILTLNTNINDNVTIYCDFDSYSIMSTIFPNNCKIIFGNDYGIIKTNVIKEQKKPFLFIENNEILKIFLEFNEQHVLKTKSGFILNKKSINNKINDFDIMNTLKEIFGIYYNKYENIINMKINQHNKLKIR